MFSRELFGERLREVRERRGETQTAVASALGCTSTFLSDMEKGRRTTTPEKIAQLCQYYNISADYLLGLSDTPRKLK